MWELPNYDEWKLRTPEDERAMFGYDEEEDEDE